MPENLPNTKSRFYRDMEDKWDKISTVIEGEEAIKAAGPTYLPKLTGQNPEQYKAYLARGSFFNATSRTVDGLTGAIVRKEPVLKTDSRIDALLGNITLDGESIQEVIRIVVSDVISKAYFGILVDMPFVAEGQTQSGNPYFALYSALSILNFETVQVGSENKLVMLALAEKEFEKNPENEFGLVEVDHVRVLKIEDNRLVVRLYKKTEDSNKKEVWAQIGDDILPTIAGRFVDTIPFVFFGAISNNPIPTKPPLLDLVNLNIKHWQVSVDYYHGLHYCAIPTPWAAGFGKSTELMIGGEKAWVSEDPNAKCGYLEFQGSGIGAVEKALINLKAEMAILGSRMLEEMKKAVEAADTVAMRYSGDTATLASIVTAVEQGMIKAIDLIGYWLGIEAKTELTMNREFVSQKLSAQEITALVGAYQTGGISLDTFLYKMQTGEVLPPDRTIEDEKSLISENMDTSFNNQNIDPETGLPIQ